MKKIRAAFVTFLLLLVVFAYLGWHWAATLPHPKMAGARGALAVIAAVSIGAIVLIWKDSLAKTN